MKKLLKGIIEFRQNVQDSYREKFAKLALEQHPDCLFVACSDSRVVPNTFASTDPGDLFVLRNIGNLIPRCGHDGHAAAVDESAGAAIEFAIINLNVTDIVICGHSECGAMKAMLDGRQNVTGAPNLRGWLRHAEPSLNQLQTLSEGMSEVNALSQFNVLQQIENLRSYASVRERLADGRLKIHGWWFELKTANVYAFDESKGQFTLIDEKAADRMLRRLPKDAH